MHAKSPSRARPFVPSFLIGSFAFCLGALLDHLMAGLGLNGRSLFLDNLGISMLVGLVVLYYEERRRRFLIEKLRTIELMNHHVRNALQVITYAPYSTDQEKQVQIVRQSVERIEWALKEVLPRGEEPDALSERSAA